MLKKRMVLILVTIGLLVITGCINNEGPLEFRAVDNWDQNMKEDIRQINKLRGFKVLEQGDEESIIYIGAGSKPTGGYGIKVEEVKREGTKTIIKVIETKPEDDALVTQQITYPFEVVKVIGATKEIEVVTNTGERIEPITKAVK